MISESHPAQEQALNAVIARATTDRVFRQQLLTEPRRAILDAFGITIPADFRIKFIEKGGDVDALVVLPDARSEPSTDGPISDADLEVVSGGAAAHHAAHHANAHLAWKGHTS